MASKKYECNATVQRISDNKKRKKKLKRRKEGIRNQYPSVNGNSITHVTTNSTVIMAIIFKTLVLLNFVKFYDCNSTNEFLHEKRFLRIIIQRLK